MAEPQDLHVLIIGTGVTGLVLAHGLKKAGIKFTVFEKEPSATHYRPREWSMSLHWSRPMLISLLPDNLVGRLREPQNNSFKDPTEKEHFLTIDASKGELMRDMPAPGLARVSRRKMRTFVTEGVDVKYGYDLKSIDSSGDQVEATFANGEKVTGSLLIGADGAKSTTREILLGDEAGLVSMDFIFSTVTVKYPAEVAKSLMGEDEQFTVGVHPKGMVFIALTDVPDPEKPETWAFTVVNNWRGEKDETLDNAARVAQVKAVASNLKEPFLSAINLIPDDASLTYDNIGYWIPKPWDNKRGTVTLCGDAAHPMPPHRGQGLNHAINDAANLVTALKKVASGEETLEKAIPEYEQEIIKRGADEVIASKQTAEYLLAYHKIMESALMQRGMARGET